VGLTGRRRDAEAVLGAFAGGAPMDAGGRRTGVPPSMDGGLSNSGGGGGRNALGGGGGGWLPLDSRLREDVEVQGQQMQQSTERPALRRPLCRHRKSVGLTKACT
jgi:hypothetical protein